MNAKILSTLALCIAGAVSAQSNTVPGLDGRLTVVDNLTYWGRRGAAYPNGEVGMSMLNTMCNPGSVVIPWHAAMADDHPKFGFLITREIGGRMVQISDWSYCKHAFTSVNVNGACGTCQNPGTGSVMGLNCSDTYGAGNNADRTYLGPPEEIDPWTGVWNPIGSYFDRGDPSVGGSAAMDGQRSLNTSGFDNVKNRVTVKEQDLLVPGARYFYGIHLIHEGESDANRHDNTASRGFNPSGTASGWTFSNNAVGQVYGSILQHWTNATVNKGKNGNDDGNFWVAVVVTPLGGSMYHYEYAIHNLDNSRGGAAYRIPVDPSGVVTNIGFRDIDASPNNDWTSARVGNELVFTAPANNPNNWNTIYNCWFDCDIAPSMAGTVLIDEARPGAGVGTVAVTARVPSGIPTAFVTSVGSGCGSCTSSFYEFFGASSAMDLSGTAMTMAFANGAYSVGPATASYVPPTGTTLNLGDDSVATVNLPFSLPFPGGSTTQLEVCSNGFISAGSNGTDFSPTTSEFLASSSPRWALAWHDLNPAAGGAVRVDSSPTAVNITWLNVADYGQTGSQSTFQAQFLSNGTVHVFWQSMSGLGSSAYLTGFTPGGGASDPGSIDLTSAIPSRFTICTSDIRGLALSASDRPILGTTFNLATTSIPTGTTFGATVLSLTQATPPLDLTVIGMPGCYAHAIGGDTFNFVPSGATHSIPLTIPSLNQIIGVNLITQSFTATPGMNALGIIASNGLILTIGMR